MRALARIFTVATVAFSAMLLQACTTTDSSVGGSNQGNPNGECKPGESKTADDGCNTCSCQQNGFWACTEKACVDPGTCKPGDSKPAGDGCNTCTCDENSNWACTKIGCVDPGECKPGETKQVDCNTCGCTEDGKWACTAMACGECTGPMPLCAAPPPGCDYVGGGCVGGQWTCGTLTCAGECKPGETKPADDGCNTCSCTDEGTWACTEMACSTPCKSDADCPQPGSPCHNAVCEAGQCTLVELPGCGNQCAPQEAKGDGLCDAWFGYAWDGVSCQSISGCSCVGADCDKLYKTPDDCKLAHEGCTSECTGPIIDCSAPPPGCNYVGGGCVNGQWTCGDLVCEAQCKSSADCPLIGAPCELCPDGSTSCPSVECIEGQCVGSFPGCPGGGIAPGLPCDKPGAEAPADDGCNTCICGDNKTWACTKIGCNNQCDGFPPPCAPPPEGCDYVNGGCVDGQWTCGELVCQAQCKVNEDCPQPDGPCLKCQGINPCAQAVCDAGKCVEIPPSCGDSCNPQDATGQGACAAFFGYAWNGKQCVGVGGCSCKGADCDKLYQDPLTCEVIHSSCQ